MSISQRKDGRWLVKYKDALTKKWKQKSFRTQHDAEAFEAETKYDREENYRPTVLESILAFLKAVPHHPVTVKAYRRLLNGPLAMLATRYVDTLTRRDLETARDSIKSMTSTHVSNATVNKEIDMFISAWRWCASEDMIDKAPWAQYRKLQTERPGTHFGDAELFMRIAAELPPAGQWAVRTMMALCCRPGTELEGVTWSCIDLDHATARIWMSKVKADKVIRIPAWWVEDARPRREKAEPGHPVCPGKWPDRPARLGLMWDRARKKIGAGPCPLYTARHLAASLMLEAGADAAAVAAQLGHRNIATTGTYYIHASDKGQLAAAAALPAPKSLVQELPGGAEMVRSGASDGRNSAE